MSTLCQWHRVSRFQRKGFVGLCQWTLLRNKVFASFLHSMMIHFIVSSLPFSTHHYVALVCLHSHYTYLCLKEGCNWDLVGFYFQVPAGPIFRLYFFSESEYFIFLNFTIFQGQQDLCPLVVVASGYPVSLRKDLLDCINGFWLRKKALSSFPTLHDHSFHRVFVAFPNLHTLCCTCFLFTHTWCLGTFLCLPLTSLGFASLFIWSSLVHSEICTIRESWN